MNDTTNPAELSKFLAKFRAEKDEQDAADASADAACVDKLRSLFGEFRLLKERDDAIAKATGARFNVFSALGVERKEVRHSAFLAALLDPNGAHSQGPMFLREFFAMLRERFPRKFAWEFANAELGRFTVIPEQGRVDIPLKTNSHCMIIENKVDAGDRPRQLGDYYDAAKNEGYPPENIAVLYLTLGGRTASAYTRGDALDENKVLCLSYGEHIFDWLDACVRAVVEIAPLREVLWQYQMLLKNDMNQPTTTLEFIMNANELFKQDGNYKLIPALEDAIAAFKVHVQYMFWDELYSQLNERFSERFGPVVVVKPGGEAFARSEDRACFEKFTNEWNANKGKKTNKDEKKWTEKYGEYGLAFRVAEVDPKEGVWFAVSIEEKIYLKFTVLKKGEGDLPAALADGDGPCRNVGSDDKPEWILKKGYIPYREALPRSFRGEDGMGPYATVFGWQYEGDLDFARLPDKLLMEMGDPKRRAARVRALVSHIAGYVTDFKENLGAGKSS